MDFNKLFYYDESSPSCLRWKVGRSFNINPGDPAGTLNNRGYWVVETGGKGYPVNRMVLHILDGFDLSSPLEVDHGDRVRSNNKRSNLTAMPKSDNLQNKGVYKSSKTGVSGVTWKKQAGKWLVQLTGNGRREHVGYFTCLLDAVAARLRAVREAGNGLPNF